MADNNLQSRADGDVAAADDVNQYRTAFVGDVVPRNSSGVKTDLAGNLGTSLLRWIAGYMQKLYLGATASGLSIEEDSGEMIFKVGGSEVVRFDASGIDVSSFPALNVLPRLKRTRYTASGTFNIPADVYEVFLFGAGGGGGGGGGGNPTYSSNDNGGQAGQGCNPILVPKSVTPGGSLTISIGAGGAGGNGDSPSGAGSNGASGGSTIITGDISGSIEFTGGGGGGKATVSNNTGSWTPRATTTTGGAGSDGSSSAVSGQATFFNNGGTLGSNGSPGGGGGGGGGAGFGVGGSGGSGINSGTAGNGFSADESAGGGGGGGNNNGSNQAGIGGDGGDGFLEVYYISHL